MPCPREEVAGCMARLLSVSVVGAGSRVLHGGELVPVGGDVCGVGTNAGGGGAVVDLDDALHVDRHLLDVPACEEAGVRVAAGRAGVDAIQRARDTAGYGRVPRADAEDGTRAQGPLGQRVVGYSGH